MTALSKVYTAFRAAGVPESEAMEAADAVQAEISDLKLSEQRIIGHIMASEGKLLGEIKLNRWMLALVIVVEVIPALVDLLP